MMAVKNFNYLLLIIAANYVIGLEICEDHYVQCPTSKCGAYPLQPLYRTHCMKSCGVCTNVNRALGKPTSQVSTQSNSQASRAVDGNINGDRSGNSCTRTNETGLSTQWWCVDLQKVYSIDTVKIYNTNDNQESLRGFKVNLGLTGACNADGFISSTTCYTDIVWISQSVYTITKCNKDSTIPLVGRFVYVSTSIFTVEESSPTPLSLCEVRIYTGTKCNHGYYSYNSTTCIACITCLESACDIDTGRCSLGCIDGYIGETCSSCSEGRFGPGCRFACNVTNCRGNCDREIGLCLECKPGYYGSNCQSSCDDSCMDGICLKSDGSCLPETMDNTSKQTNTDTGTSRAVVGIIGVVCGVAIACLASCLHYILLKRRKLYEIPNSQPKPVLEIDYVSNEQSVTNSRYIEMKESENISCGSQYSMTHNVPRRNVSTFSMGNESKYQQSTTSIETGNQYGCKQDKPRRMSTYSLKNESEYVPCDEIKRRVSVSSIEKRPPAELPINNKKQLKSQISETNEKFVEYQNESFSVDDGYDPYESVTCEC